MDKRQCPKCSTTMEYRLGELECPDCGHAEPARLPEANPKASGPGFQRPQQWQGGIQPPTAPRAAAPAQLGFDQDVPLGELDHSAPTFGDSLLSKSLIIVSFLSTSFSTKSKVASLSNPWSLPYLSITLLS